MSAQIAQIPSPRLHSLYQDPVVPPRRSPELEKALAQVVDIFAEVDDPNQPGPILYENTAPRPKIKIKGPGYEWDKILFFSVWLAIAILFFVGLWYSAFRLNQALTKSASKSFKPETKQNKAINKSPQTIKKAPITSSTEATSTLSATSTNSTATKPVFQDSDLDGLSDNQEARLNTNPKKADTDGDGLLDGEEVNIYQTDPLDPDTDKDGFNDGEEVMAGYNPRGAGKLKK